MPPSPAPALRGFSRRALLVASGGAALLAAGCTGGPEDPDVSTAQADQLAGQIAVQEALVAAYTAAAAADAALAGPLTELSDQVRAQLDRLRAAAPPAGTSPAAAPPPAAVPPAGGDVRGWLRGQVAAAAEAHTAACIDQTGPRAALLGSLAAGLRGHQAALA